MQKQTYYHEVFIPTPGVFIQAGSNIFPELDRKKLPGKSGRNLLVFPSSYGRILNPSGNREKRSIFGGGEDVLQKLNNSMDKKRLNREEALKHVSRNTSETTLDNIVILRFSEGLDVAYILDDSLDPANAESLAGLEKKAHDLWLSSSKKKRRPEIITTKLEQKLHLKALGLNVEDPKFLLASADRVHYGIRAGTDDLLAILQSEKKISSDQASESLSMQLYPNQFIKFQGTQHPLYARVVHSQDGKSEVMLLEDKEYSREHIMKIGNHEIRNLFGITPLDMEQYLAMQYGLLNKDVELFFLCGTQGSGKTILSFAAALDQILWYDKEWRIKRGLTDDKIKNLYEKIILINPTTIIGDDIGFLPGDMFDKLLEYYKPYVKAMEAYDLQNITFTDLVKGTVPKDTKVCSNSAHFPPRRSAIDLQWIGSMRGLTLRDKFILIDEAQNMTPYQMFTILQRIGEGSKVVVMGDPDQLDNPHCTKEINGLTYAIKHFLPEIYSSLIFLSRHYRHQMSDHARRAKVYNVR